MASIDIGSDLLEMILTPEEEALARQFKDPALSIALLRNTRVSVMRQLAMQEFTDPNEDGTNHRARAYLKGQYDILIALENGAVEAQQEAANSQQQF